MKLAYVYRSVAILSPGEKSAESVIANPFWTPETIDRDSKDGMTPWVFNQFAAVVNWKFVPLGSW